MKKIPETAEREVWSETGLGVGFQETSISPVAPHVSSSPYHMPTGSGEKRFFNDADISAELGKVSVLAARKEIISKSLEDTMEDARTPDEDFDIKPVLLGLRKSILQIRIDRTEKRIAQLEEQKIVSAHVVDRVSQGRSYITPTDPLRPKGFRQKLRAGRIDRTNEHTQRLGAKKHHYEGSLGPDVTTDSYMDRMRRRPLSIGEKITHKKFNLMSRGIKGAHEKTSEWRERIADKPARKQQKHIQRRQRQQATLEAIQEAQEAKS